MLAGPVYIAVGKVVLVVICSRPAPPQALGGKVVVWLGNLHELEVGPPPPVMKTFKEFLLSLDDSVDETESVKRYNEYKIEFRRQQMQDFFLAHKDEE
ncbi:hypothetical protein chiPu_0030427, partial [Chiloscyllium punctatum]|nr:hypothetical protein [Chiloscyllium punctatum]